LKMKRMADKFRKKPIALKRAAYHILVRSFLFR